MVVAVVTLPWWIQWNWLRKPLEDFSSMYTGRQVRITGDLDVDLGRTTSVSIESVSVSDADWSDHEHLVSVGRIDVGLKLASLFKPHKEFSHWKIDGLNLFLNRNEDGRGNWEFSDPDDEEPVADEEDKTPLRAQLPIPHEIVVTDSQIRVLDKSRDLDSKLVIESLRGTGSDDAPFKLEGNGQYQDSVFKIGAQGGDFGTLKDHDAPYPLRLDAQFGDTSAEASGELPKADGKLGIDLGLAIRGKNLEDLYQIIGVPLPATPPYRLKGRLTQDGDVWSFRKFAGAVGDSDLEGNLAVDVGGERMRIDADLQSKLLDFDDLAPLIGVPPDASESASDTQQEQAQEYDADPKAIPDDPLPLTKLKVADAAVKLRAKRVNAPDLPIDDLVLDITLDNGRLRLKPVNFGVAKGDVSLFADIDTGQQPVDWNLDARLQKLQLGPILAEAGLDDAGVGLFNGELKLRAKGDTLHDVARTGNGHASVSMGGGQISGLLLELIGVDVAEAIGFLASGDDPASIRCVVADFDIDDGQVKSRRLVFDTSDTRIDGEFSANLENESFELELSPKPKDSSAFSARTPVKVKGTFKDIAVSPDYGAIGLRLGAAGVLGSVLTPVAALLAFIEPGNAEDAECGSLQSSESDPSS